MATTWVVTGQRQFEDLTGAGQFVEMMEVSFQVTATGDPGSITVPIRDYTVEEVSRRIEARVKTMLGVAGL